MLSVIPVLCADRAVLGIQGFDSGFIYSKYLDIQSHLTFGMHSGLTFHGQCTQADLEHHGWLGGDDLLQRFAAEESWDHYGGALKFENYM